MNSGISAAIADVIGSVNGGPLFFFFFQPAVQAGSHSKVRKLLMTMLPSNTMAAKVSQKAVARCRAALKDEKFSRQSDTFDKSATFHEPKDERLLFSASITMPYAAGHRGKFLEYARRELQRVNHPCKLVYSPD